MIDNAGSGGFRSLDPGTAGFRFTVGGSSNVTVNSLGYIDQGLNGLSTSHFVAIWDSAGAKVAEVNVGSGTSATLIDDFRYVDLTAPVILTVGETYIIGGQTTGSDLFRDPGSGIVVDPIFTNLTGRWIQEGTGGYSRPTNQGADPGYIAANMLYMVPEPTVIAPLTLAGLALLARRRRQA